jgi:hypothetical protein
MSIDCLVQLEPPTPPSPEVIQRARNGISGFIAATGRQLNGGVGQWERKRCFSC